MLNLHPWEFTRYTPGEIKAKLKGFNDLRKSERQLAAWAVANLMNATGNYKETITPAGLLGESKKQAPKTAQQRKQEHDELVKRFNERRKKKNGQR
jgi:hypothetical protein